jgi:hypothetical protein
MSKRISLRLLLPFWFSSSSGQTQTSSADRASPAKFAAPAPLPQITGAPTSCTSSSTPAAHQTPRPPSKTPGIQDPVAASAARPQPPSPTVRSGKGQIRLRPSSRCGAGWCGVAEAM